MKKYLTLFFTFLKIGLFTFGGGYAMIALMENEFIIKKKWIDKEEFLDMTAIAESTPGPVAINSSTYLGYKLGGFLGAAISTLAVCIPSFIIIFIVSHFLDRFMSFKPVACAFKGIQVCVIYLILSAGIKLLKNLKKEILTLVILVAVILSMTVFSIFSVSFSSVFYILICGAIGLSSYCIKSSKGDIGK